MSFQLGIAARLGLSLELGWPNGLRQGIVLFAVPQDGRDSRIMRFYFRNDEEQVPEASVTCFERGLIDQPIALMHQRLRQLLDGPAATPAPSH